MLNHHIGHFSVPIHFEATPSSCGSALQRKIYENKKKIEVNKEDDEENKIKMCPNRLV